MFLNGRKLGQLPQDENDMITYLSLAPGTLISGKNTLRIAPAGGQTDDVLVGEIRIEDRPRQEILRQANVAVTVVDAEDGGPLPCRITVVDSNGSLVPLGAESNPRLAVSTGVIYSVADPPKPYQPATEEWTPYVIGSTGAVWVKADGASRSPNDTLLRHPALDPTESPSQQFAVTELQECRARGFFLCRAARQQFFVAVLQVLRPFLNDLHLNLGIKCQRQRFTNVTYSGRRSAALEGIRPMPAQHACICPGSCRHA